MSNKLQHTAASMREKMLTRYGDNLHHKHNKYHLQYRSHAKTYPCIKANGDGLESTGSGATGLIRKFKLRKMRKRLDKGKFH